MSPAFWKRARGTQWKLFVEIFHHHLLSYRIISSHTKPPRVYNFSLSGFVFPFLFVRRVHVWGGRRSNFPHLKRVASCLGMLHGVENRVWVDAQIISSCHFHRFHYDFPPFITSARVARCRRMLSDDELNFRATPAEAVLSPSLKQAWQDKYEKINFIVTKIFPSSFVARHYAIVP